MPAARKCPLLDDAKGRTLLVVAPDFKGALIKGEDRARGETWSCGRCARRLAINITPGSVSGFAVRCNCGALNALG